MESPTTKSLRLFQFTCLVFVALAFWVLRQECVQAELGGYTCLAQVSSPMAQIRAFGTHILNRHWNYPLYEVKVAVGCLAIVFFVLLIRRRCSWWAFAYLAAVTLAIGGEYSALLRNQLHTLLYHVGAVCLVAIAFVLLLRRAPELLSQGWLETKRRAAKVRPVEVVAVLALLVIACVTRFHQLNRNPSGYDAEACPHRMIADSWTTILQQEIGEHVQQSSGLSSVVLHRLFTRINHASLFYLDERVMGVAISLLGCVVMYFFMRNLRGAYAACLALILYVFGPLDLEWSRLPVMHHVPVVLSLLLAWATFNALSTRSWASFLALMALIPCTKFVYPSAKLVLFGPLAAIVGIVIFQRKEWWGHYRKLLCIFIGAALFVGLRSLAFYLVHGRFELIPPFDNPYPSHVQTSQLERIQKMLIQGSYFFYEIFYAPAEPTHWTTHAMVQPIRSLSSITVVFTGLVLTRLLFLIKRPEALVFIGMIVGGLIPGMATALADRRVAVSLTLCIVLAVLELSWLLDVVVARASRRLAGVIKFFIPVCLIGCLGISQTTEFFGRFNSRPIQMQVGDTALQMLKDDTLVVYLADERRCEMFYTLYTRMVDAGGSIAFATADDGLKNAQQQILEPGPVFSSWYYAHTALAAQVERIKETKQWRRYLFIFQPTANREAWRTLLKETYPYGKETIVSYPSMPGQRMLFYEVEQPEPVLNASTDPQVAVER